MKSIVAVGGDYLIAARSEEPLSPLHPRRSMLSRVNYYIQIQINKSALHNLAASISAQTNESTEELNRYPSV